MTTSHQSPSGSSSYVAEIPLTRGKVVLIDRADLPLIKGHKWYPVKRGNNTYAVCGGSCCSISMHRLLFPDSEIVDHINMNGLDNRRCNLRPCNKSQNMANRGACKNNKLGIKGVSYCKATGRYRADINCNGKRRNLGRFATPEEAAAAYITAAKILFGEFARS